MTNTVQDFLAAATQKAAADLITALETIPAEKRGWKPNDTARSAMDMVAECAILNGTTAESIESRSAPSAAFMREFFDIKASLAQDEVATRALLHTNTARVIAALGTFPAENMETEITMPWGQMTYRALGTYPFWNMTYHQGQVIYIASLLAE